MRGFVALYFPLSKSAKIFKPQSHLAEYFSDVYDRDRCAIANNLKTIGKVIVSVEKK